jgi:hypothetical protein
VRPETERVSEELPADEDWLELSAPVLPLKPFDPAQDCDV